MKDGPQKDICAFRLKLYQSNVPYRDDVSLAVASRDLLDDGNFAEAEPLARECLALRKNEIPDDWRSFNARVLLGRALLGLKKYAEAEPLLLTGYKGMEQRAEKMPAKGRAHLKETLQSLVQLYEQDEPANQRYRMEEEIGRVQYAQKVGSSRNSGEPSAANQNANGVPSFSVPDEHGRFMGGWSLEVEIKVSPLRQQIRV